MWLDFFFNYWEETTRYRVTIQVRLDFPQSGSEASQQYIWETERSTKLTNFDWLLIEVRLIKCPNFSFVQHSVLQICVGMLLNPTPENRVRPIFFFQFELKCSNDWLRKMQRNYCCFVFWGHLGNYTGMCTSEFVLIYLLTETILDIFARICILRVMG